MTEPDLPERVTRLEREVAEARKDAAAARILAGGADRDVSDMQAQLRAHTQSLNALRDTQVEMRAEMVDMRSEMGDMRSEMRAGFTTMAAGQAHIVTLLTSATDESEEG